MIMAIRLSKYIVEPHTLACTYARAHVHTLAHTHAHTHDERKRWQSSYFHFVITKSID